MSILTDLQWRYAAKKFDDTKQVSNEQLEILKQAFNLTATSYGLQPLKLVVVKNKAIQEQLVAHSWNQQQIVQASHVLVICVPTAFTSEHVEDYFKLVKKVRNTPNEILNPFKDFLSKDVASKTQEQLFAWNKNQAYIALGNLLNVCAVERIDSCPMEGFNPEKYDEILGLDKHNLRSVLVLPIGFRAEDDYMKNLQKVRKDVDDVVITVE